MGRRNGFGRKPKDSCVVVIIACGLLISLGWFLNSAAGWIV